MQLYPAIDLKDGACVRLKRGDMKKATRFARPPIEQASHFVALGFEWLHIIDLDGAIAGAQINGAAIAAIRNHVDVPLQLGGGIRDRDSARYWLDLGIDRLILGTAAIRDPDMAARLCQDYPGQIAIALDHIDGKLAIEGWVENTTLTPDDLMANFESAGAAAFILTDIARDGIFAGLDCAAATRLAHRTEVPVIVSGGLASLADVHHLLRPENRLLAGAVIGRALYEGRLDAAAAITAIRDASC